MRFVETPVFTDVITELLSDEEYRSLQLTLLFRPEAGALIRGSRGLRKIRWSVKGKGKRGGCRLIYYWDVGTETFFMLSAFRKNRQEDLTMLQLRHLTRLVREEFE
jgi:mRNA-degrading endonuclease RelE of RelBE toxin-antitoxin system